MAFSYYGYELIKESDLAHHGILGQKWGVRRYQNSDGTLTNAGKKRYSWLKDKLGYDERDDARRATQLRKATESAMAKVASDRERTKLNVRNANNRLEKANYNQQILFGNGKPGEFYYLPSTGTKKKYTPYYFALEENDDLPTYTQANLEIRRELRELGTELAEAEEADANAKQAVDYWVNESAKRREIEKKAVELYERTPLGIIDKADKQLKKAANWVKSLFKK